MSATSQDRERGDDNRHTTWHTTDDDNRQTRYGDKSLTTDVRSGHHLVFFYNSLGYIRQTPRESILEVFANVR